MIAALDLKTPISSKTPQIPSIDLTTTYIVYGNFSRGRKRCQAIQSICPLPSGQICKQSKYMNVCSVYIYFKCWLNNSNVLCK